MILKKIVGYNIMERNSIYNLFDNFGRITRGEFAEAKYEGIIDRVVDLINDFNNIKNEYSSNIAKADHIDRILKEYNYIFRELLRDQPAKYYMDRSELCDTLYFGLSRKKHFDQLVRVARLFEQIMMFEFDMYQNIGVKSLAELSGHQINDLYFKEIKDYVYEVFEEFKVCIERNTDASIWERISNIPSRSLVNQFKR